MSRHLLTTAALSRVEATEILDEAERIAGFIAFAGDKVTLARG